MTKKADPLRQTRRKLKKGKARVQATAEPLKDKASSLSHRAEQVIPDPVRDAMDTVIDQAGAVGTSVARSPRRRRLLGALVGAFALVGVALTRRRK